MKILKYLLVVIGLLFCSSDLFSAKTGWYKVFVPTDTIISNHSFYDSNFGIVTTLKNELFLTYDGGKTFVDKTKTIINIINKNLFLIKVTKPNEIYLTTDKQIYLSNDTCKTWIMLNSISLSNDTINCTNFYKINDICYCSDDNYRFFQNENPDTTKIFYSFDNTKSWNLLHGLKNDRSINLFHKVIFLDSNQLVIVAREYYWVNGNPRKRVSPSYFLNKIDQDISAIYADSLLRKDITLDFISVAKTPNSNLFFQFQNSYIMKSTNFGLNWSKFGLSGTNWDLYPLNNDLFYGVNFNFITKINKNSTLSCIGEFDSDIQISNIEVINEKIAYAFLSNSTIYGKNYFLKTEDGGGVDISDVEEVIPQEEITQSTHIELFDILGRSIATYTNYEKLKAEIENYPPPHLIKWRDEKGIFHFERLK